MDSTTSVTAELRHSSNEGFFSSIYQNLTSPLFVTFLVILGISNSSIALVVAGGAFFAMLGGIPSAWLIEKTGHMKRIASICMGFGALAWLLMAFVPFSGGYLVLLVFLLFSAYSFFSSSFSVAWSSWMGDILPKNVRPSFFAKRNYFVAIGSLGALLFSTIFIGFFDKTNIFPFQLLFGFSFIFAIFALLNLFKIKRSTEPVLKEKYHFFRAIKYVAEEKGFVEFITFMVLWNLGVYVIAPFIAVYAINELGFHPMWIPIMSFAYGLGSIVTMKMWGKLIEAHGSRTILITSTMGACLFPFFWLFITEPIQAFLMYFFSGLFYGFLHASFNYQLDLTPATKRAKYLSLFALFTGFPLVIAPFLGSFILEFFKDSFFGFDAFFWLFVISGIFRLGTLVSAGILKEPRKYRTKAIQVFGELAFGTAETISSSFFKVVHISNVTEVRKIFLKRVIERLQEEKEKTTIVKNLKVAGFSMAQKSKISEITIILSSANKKVNNLGSFIFKSEAFFSILKSANRSISDASELRRSLFAKKPKKNDLRDV